MDTKAKIEVYTKILRNAADFMEHIQELDSHMSGNGKETVLQCFGRIAQNEPENPMYEHAASNIRTLSEALYTMREELACASGAMDTFAEHFNIYNDKGWFHEQEVQAQ